MQCRANSTSSHSNNVPLYPHHIGLSVHGLQRQIAAVALYTHVASTCAAINYYQCMYANDSQTTHTIQANKECRKKRPLSLILPRVSLRNAPLTRRACIDERRGGLRWSTEAVAYVDNSATIDTSRQCTKRPFVHSSALREATSIHKRTMQKLPIVSYVSSTLRRRRWCAQRQAVRSRALRTYVRTHTKARDLRIACIVACLPVLS